MKKYLEIPRSHLTTIQKDYRCAGCWNPVIAGFDKAGDFLVCETEDCNLPGLVSVHWVDGQIAQSEAEAITARKILQDSFEWLRLVTKTKLTKAEILKQLGY